MKIRIKRLSPLQAGKMFAAFYALVCAIAVPIVLIVVLVGHAGFEPPTIMVVVLPLLYIVGGFVVGLIGSFIYNLVAGWIGGIEVDYEERA